MNVVSLACGHRSIIYKSFVDRRPSTQPPKAKGGEMAQYYSRFLNDLRRSRLRSTSRKPILDANLAHL